MTIIPQTEPISNFKNDQTGVLHKIKNGPVVLLQYSKPAAVLVDPQQWNRMLNRLQAFERAEMIRQRVADAHVNPGTDIAFDDFMVDLVERDNASG